MRAGIHDPGAARPRRQLVLPQVQEASPSLQNARPVATSRGEPSVIYVMFIIVICLKCCCYNDEDFSNSMVYILYSIIGSHGLNYHTDKEIIGNELFGGCQILKL